MEEVMLYRKLERNSIKYTSHSEFEDSDLDTEFPIKFAETFIGTENILEITYQHVLNSKDDATTTVKCKSTFDPLQIPNYSTVKFLKGKFKDEAEFDKCEICVYKTFIKLLVKDSLLERIKKYIDTNYKDTKTHEWQWFNVLQVRGYKDLKSLTINIVNRSLLQKQVGDFPALLPWNSESMLYDTFPSENLGNFMKINCIEDSQFFKRLKDTKYINFKDGTCTIDKKMKNPFILEDFREALNRLFSQKQYEEFQLSDLKSEHMNLQEISENEKRLLSQLKVSGIIEVMGNKKLKFKNDPEKILLTNDQLHDFNLYTKKRFLWLDFIKYITNQPVTNKYEDELKCLLTVPSDKYSHVTKTDMKQSKKHSVEILIQFLMSTSKSKFENEPILKECKEYCTVSNCIFPKEIFEKLLSEENICPLRALQFLLMYHPIKAEINYNMLYLLSNCRCNTHNQNEWRYILADGITVIPPGIELCDILAYSKIKKQLILFHVKGDFSRDNGRKLISQVRACSNVLHRDLIKVRSNQSIKDSCFEKLSNVLKDNAKNNKNEIIKSAYTISNEVYQTVMESIEKNIRDIQFYVCLTPGHKPAQSFAMVVYDSLPNLDYSFKEEDFEDLSKRTTSTNLNFIPKLKEKEILDDQSRITEEFFTTNNLKSKNIYNGITMEHVFDLMNKKIFGQESFVYRGKDTNISYMETIDFIELYLGTFSKIEESKLKFLVVDITPLNDFSFQNFKIEIDS